jgi:phosphate-selective porin OprO/OprP
VTVVRPLAVGALLLVAAGAPALAHAQTGQPSAAPGPPAPSGGADGFVIESANGDFRLQIGLLVHVDARFALDDSAHQVTDGFSLRRVRPSLRGRLARRFEFYLNPDFAGGTLVVQDAYIDTVFSPAFRVRAGKAKTPFGFERAHAASNLLFLERGLPTSLVPNRDVGIQVLGDLSGGIISYLAGVMNGVPDGGSVDADTNDGKDVSARVVVRPLKSSANHPFRGLGFGLSGSTGHQSGAGTLPTLRTPTLQQAYFSYATAVADGRRTRYSPHVFYFHKAFGGWGEYVHTRTPITGGAATGEEIGHDAWQIAVSYVLTGETATDAGAGVRPRADFGNGSWGAWQVAARYHALVVDEDAITRQLATPGSSRTAEGWTVGLRWYLTRNMWNTVNFERTVFGDPDGPRPAENALAFRTQFDF